MPYTQDNLPDAVKRLPAGARKIWVAAFNAAFEEYGGDEKKAFAVAWAAVKKKYKQGKDGKWHPIQKEGEGNEVDPTSILKQVQEFNAGETTKDVVWADRAERGVQLARKASDVLGGTWRYRAGRVEGPYDPNDVTVWMAAGAVKDLGVDDDGTHRVGGYAVLWGDPDHKDLTGEYFTPDTEELDRLFKGIGRLPLIYRHAGDDELKTSVVGVVDYLVKDSMGLWYEAQIKAADRYRQAIIDLIRKQKLGTSSGTLPRARRVAKDGRILRWPIVEISLTPMPAEPRLMVQYPVGVVKEHFAECGLEFKDLESEEEEHPPTEGVSSTGDAGCAKETGEESGGTSGETGDDALKDAVIEVARMWVDITKEILEEG